MGTINIHLPPLAQYQIDAIFCSAGASVVEASTKCGKTISCVYWLLSEACNVGRPGREFWWVAPIVPQAEIALNRMVTTWRQIDPAGQNWSARPSEKAIRLSNGAIIRFKSADNPDSLYGEDVWAAVIDEASRCKEPAWHAVRSTLTATGGRLRIIGNVKGRKNWAYQLGQKAKAGREGWHYARITASDAVKAGILTAAAVEQARQDLPDHVFRELYMAEAQEDGSNPFGETHILACTRPLSNKPPVCFGVDVARKQDWTVVVGLDADRQVCVLDRWQRVPWTETIDRIHAHCRGKRTLVDATGVGDAVVDALQRKGGGVYEPFVFTERSRQELVEGLIVAVQRGEVGFPEGPITDELGMFEYEYTRTGVRYVVLEGAHDDAAFALALAVKHAGVRGSRFYDPSAVPTSPVNAGAVNPRHAAWLRGDD